MPSGGVHPIPNRLRDLQCREYEPCTGTLELAYSPDGEKSNPLMKGANPSHGLHRDPD